MVDYALGSGHHATTFVTVVNLDPLSILEHRLTHYTHDGTLGITPRHAANEERLGNGPEGRELTVEESRKCRNCHATQLSAADPAALDPTTMIPAVTCERCHGPGRAHVQAARLGADETALSLPMGPGRWTVRSQLELCGKCHRHPSRMPPSRLNPDDRKLARFQPMRLSQSRCFKATGGAMSCVSCHDPHARASSDTASYERVCVGCHQPAPAQSALEAVEAPSPPPAADRSARSRRNLAASPVTCRGSIRASMCFLPIAGSELGLMLPQQCPDLIAERTWTRFSRAMGIAWGFLLQLCFAPAARGWSPARRGRESKEAAGEAGRDPRWRVGSRARARRGE